MLHASSFYASIPLVLIELEWLIVLKSECWILLSSFWVVVILINGGGEKRTVVKLDGTVGCLFVSIRLPVMLN